MKRLARAILVRKIKRFLREHPEALTVLVAIAQTENTTTTPASLDLSPMVNVVVAVIPLFVLVAVLKILFRSFKDIA